MENSSSLVDSIIGIAIFLIIVAIGIVAYKKIMFPVPKRDTIIKKPYFLRDRYEHKLLARYAEKTEMPEIKKYLLALNFNPVSSVEDVWYLKQGGHEYYLHLKYKNQIIYLQLFSRSIFTLTKMSLILEQVLGNEELSSASY